jgi:hypothetical protein
MRKITCAASDGTVVLKLAVDNVGDHITVKKFNDCVCDQSLLSAGKIHVMARCVCFVFGM